MEADDVDVCTDIDIISFHPTVRVWRALLVVNDPINGSEPFIGLYTSPVAWRNSVGIRKGTCPCISAVHCA